MGVRMNKWINVGIDKNMKLSLLTNLHLVSLTPPQHTTTPNHTTITTPLHHQQHHTTTPKLHHHRDLIELFTTNEIMRWTTLVDKYEKQLLAAPNNIFNKDFPAGLKRWKALKSRIVEHVGSFEWWSDFE